MDPKDSSSHNSEIYDMGDSHFWAQTLQFYSSGWQMGKLPPLCPYDGAAPLFRLLGRNPQLLRHSTQGLQRKSRSFPER